MLMVPKASLFNCTVMDNLEFNKLPQSINVCSVSRSDIMCDVSIPRR